MVLLENILPFYRRNYRKGAFSYCPLLTPYPYTEQELQVSAEQVLQALPEAESPSEFLRNREGTLSAEPPQSGHTPASSAWLIGRNISNLRLHFEQKYSYIGIAFLFQAIRQRLLP